jgi:nucleotide-binding universal stress UspA family protein
VIAVGVDGSAGGRRALRFAVAEAHRRHCPMLVVQVVPPDADVEAAKADARAEVESAGGLPLPQIEVEVEISKGDPAEALIEVSERVELLVVGSHATSSLIHSALGSVSAACAQLARCPVVVVPPAAER